MEKMGNGERTMRKGERMPVNGMHVTEKGERTKSGTGPLQYLFFILLAYVLTGVLLLTLAFLTWRLELGSRAVSIGVIVIYAASTFLAGFLAGKKAKRRKWLWGLLMGAGYFMILAGVSLLTDPGEAGMRFLPSLLLCLGGGTLGGMLC